MGVITDPGYDGRRHEEIAEAAVTGGATLVQLRDKDASSRELYEAARYLRDLTREHGVTLIVNDRVDIALAVHADGVHVGEVDLPVSAARRLLGPDRIVGASAATVEEAMRAERYGASYLGVGPVYYTATKSDAGEAIGLARLAAIAEATTIPVVGIGGITQENAAEVIRAGGAGVAVISAVAGTRDMVAATQALVEVVHGARR